MGEDRSGGAIRRLHYLDALRAAIMSMGVVRHADFIDNGWVAQFVTYSSALFRMETFFFLAGFFAMMAHDRYSMRYLYWDRIFRIGVPFLVFVLLFNPLTNYLAYYHTVDFPSVGAAIHAYFTRAADQPDWVGWHLHLWFLLVMLIYCLMLRPFLAMMDSAPVRWGVGWLTRENHNSATIVLVIALVAACGALGGRAVHFLAVAPLLEGTEFNFVVRQTLQYPIYFLLGLIAYRNVRIFEALHRPPWGQVALIFLLLLVFELLDARLEALFGHTLVSGSHKFVQALAGVYIMATLIRLASRLVHEPHRWVRFLSEASYTVYLAHTFLLVGVYSLLELFVSPPSAVAYVAVMAIVYALCLLIHRHVVEPWAATRLLLNGRVDRSVLYRLAGGGDPAGRPGAAAEMRSVRRTETTEVAGDRQT